MHDWHSSVLGQILLAAHNHDEHVLVGVFQVLGPLVEVIERLFIIDGVAEHANSRVLEEEMCEVVNRLVASGIPNVQL